MREVTCDFCFCVNVEKSVLPEQCSRFEEATIKTGPIGKTKLSLQRINYKTRRIYVGACVYCVGEYITVWQGVLEYEPNNT